MRMLAVAVASLLMPANVVALLLLLPAVLLDVLIATVLVAVAVAVSVLVLVLVVRPGVRGTAALAGPAGHQGCRHAGLRECGGVLGGGDCWGWLLGVPPPLMCLCVFVCLFVCVHWKPVREIYPRIHRTGFDTHQHMRNCHKTVAVSQQE